MPGARNATYWSWGDAIRLPERRCDCRRLTHPSCLAGAPIEKQKLTGEWQWRNSRSWSWTRERKRESLGRPETNLGSFSWEAPTHSRGNGVKRILAAEVSSVSSSCSLSLYLLSSIPECQSLWRDSPELYVTRGQRRVWLINCEASGLSHEIPRFA